MSDNPAPTSTFPDDTWDERSERIYTGEELEYPESPAPPLAPKEWQYQEYGGLSGGAAFFGWLSATGIIIWTAALVLGAGILLDLVQDPTRSDVTIGQTTLVTVAIVGTVLLLLGVYAGSYAAGRLVRFDGGRQGVAVWVLVLVSGLVAAGMAVVADGLYALRARSWFPETTIAESDLLLWGSVGTGAALLLALLVAIGGGKLGVRYHAKVDRAGREADPVTAPPVDDTPPAGERADRKRRFGLRRRRSASTVEA